MMMMMMIIIIIIIASLYWKTILSKTALSNPSATVMNDGK